MVSMEYGVWSVQYGVWRICTVYQMYGPVEHISHKIALGKFSNVQILQGQDAIKLKM